jgi:signal transduction histidine kinase
MMREDGLTIVTHELRNSLQSLCLNLHHLRAMVVDEPAATKLDRALRALARVINIADDLRDAEHLSRGLFRISFKHEIIDAIIADAVETIAPVAHERRITLSVDIQCDHFAAVYCDATRLCQALTNLLGNAVKFSSPDSKVVMAITRQEHDLMFSVRDSGPGIAPDDLPHIFEKYWRTSDSHGSGLGLFISRQIIEAHGGILLVDSVVGQGSTFSFALPAVPLAGVEASQAAIP